jgi:hypothetical protein
VKLDTLSLNANCCHSCKKVICCLFIAVPALLFQSCELEPNPTGNNVEVQVLNVEGFMMDSRNLFGVNVSIGNYPIYMPDYKGYCRIENVHTPYNLQVGEWSTFYDFRGLNTRDTKIVTMSNYGSSINECYQEIIFPTIERGKKGFIHFISKDMFEQEFLDHFTINEYVNSTNIEVDIPSDKKSISGKLIFMQCYDIGSFYPEVSEYFNFGIKDVTLHPGLNDTVVFSQNDIAFNPEETTTEINVTYPQHYSNYYMVVYLSFPEYNKNSDIMIGYYYPDYLITQVVPSALNIPFNIKIESNCWNFEGYMSYRYKNVEIEHVHPGQNCNIQHQKTTLLSPQNNEEGINSTSILKAEDNGDKGVYVFFIGFKGDSSGRGLYTFTDKNELKLDNKLINFILAPNTWYAWSAGKYSTFNSIDDFVSEPFVISEKYHSFKRSDIRFFKTAP